MGRPSGATLSCGGDLPTIAPIIRNNTIKNKRAAIIAGARHNHRQSVLTSRLRLMIQRAKPTNPAAICQPKNTTIRLAPAVNPKSLDGVSMNMINELANKASQTTNSILAITWLFILHPRTSIMAHLECDPNWQVNSIPQSRPD